MTVQVDDPPLGDLAQPRKRIAVADLGRGQGPDRFGTCLLKNIVRLDLPAQSRAELPLNEGHKLRAVRRDKIGQRLRLTLVNAGDKLVAHAASFEASQKRRTV